MLLKYILLLTLLPACYFLSAQTDSLRVYFEIAETQLSADDKLQIKKFFLYDTLDHVFHYQLVSSADYLGSYELNRKISDARLESVEEYLTTIQRIGSDQIETRSLGEIDSSTGMEGPEGEYFHRAVLIIRTQPDTTDEMRKIANAAVGDTLRLRNLNFQPGRHVLLQESVPELKKLLTIMQANPTLQIEIQGHICCLNDPVHTEGLDLDTGKRELSINRALNIYNYLIKNGIDSTRLSYKGFGVTRRLIYPEKTPADMRQNRRVEIKITGK